MMLLSSITALLLLTVMLGFGFMVGFTLAMLVPSRPARRASSLKG
jgi:hypothetical protein